jgi:hypothetical protein
LKKLIGSVRFRFYKPKNKKTKPNRTQTKKTGKNERNRFEPVFIQKNRTELKPAGLNRFRFFLKNFNLIIFFDKNQTEQKIITPDHVTR